MDWAAIEAALARRFEAEAASLWHDWTGALVVAVASLVAGGDLAAVRRQPDSGARPCGIVMLRAHCIEIDGGSLPQLVRLAGGLAEETGFADGCPLDELAAALSAPVVGGLFVTTPTRGRPTLAEFAHACRSTGRASLALLLADEPSPVAALDAGLDLVVVRPPELPVCGAILGSSAMIAACALQDRGIGRAFRAGPLALEALSRALA